MLAERGLCPFVTKADQARAAGAIGIILSDNRQGEANGIPVQMVIPGGMIANLDGDHLRAAMAATGGQTSIRVGHDPLELETGRSGVITSFSSAGPTAFGHALKPDVSAPGGQILSSTLPNTNASRFAVFDGTSMATPHVAGAAALLLQLHPGWTPPEVKSALVSTAGPAWADTGRTQEAPVTLEGGGLVALPGAADPRVFTDPVSLSFPDVNVLAGAASSALLVRIEDAGGGAGTWSVGLQSQAATAGASIDIPGTVVIAPGGEADLSVVVRASADAVQGENYGFVVLHQGSVTRRVPYFFLVDKPALAQATVLPLKKLQSGDTRTGVDRVDAYRYPVAPFGNAPDSPPMTEDGAEKVYVTTLNAPAANAGVSVVGRVPGVQIDPFYLGALDENTVQGYAGTPVDVNALTYDYLDPISAAGSSFPRQQTFYVAVDSGRDRFTGQRLAGPYVLRSWVNDVTPPTLKLLTTQVAAGRPTIVVRSLDTQSGVDPLSLTIGYKGVLVGAASYDPISGIAVFPLPTSAPTLKTGQDHGAARVVRLRGGEERRHDRDGDHAEHPLRLGEAAGRRRRRRQLARPGDAGVPRQVAAARRRRELDERREVRPLRGRRPHRRRREERRRRSLRRDVEGLGRGEARQALADRDRGGRRRSHRLGAARSSSRASERAAHRRRDRRLLGDRRRARPRPRRPRLALRPARAPRRASPPARRGDRRRVRGLRRLRPRSRRRRRRTRARAAPEDPPAREQRRHPGTRDLPRRRPRPDRAA